MKNIHYTLFTLLLTLVLFNPTLQAQSYCENGAYSSDYFWIESLASDDFYNSAGPLQGVLDDNDHLYQGYVDYTDQVISWQAGLNSLELTPGVLIPNFPMYWQVWIDFNMDHVFTSDELVVSEQDLGSVTQTIDLSDLALTQDLVTRMRVSMRIIEPAPVCGGFDMGEVEDYTVRIQVPIHSTLRVPEDFNTIQSAIDAAMPGDRVLVNDGTYYEYLNINKPLIVESVNGYDTTTVIGVTNQHVFDVQSADVTIRGFDLAGASNAKKAGINFDEDAHNGQAIDNRCANILGNEANDVGVFIDSANNISVDGLVCITEGLAGIWAEQTSDSRFINNTAMNQRSAGIYLISSTNLTIENNFVSQNQLAGININKITGGLIASNSCSTNEKTDAMFSGGYGISVIFSDDITLIDNQCNENSGIGISTRISNDIEIIANTTNDNDKGIHIGAVDVTSIINNISNNNYNEGVLIASSDQVIMKDNEVLLNGLHGLSLLKSNQAQITNNQFLSNGKGVNIRESNGMVFSSNTIEAPEISSSDCQFLLYRSSNNEFFLNNFIMDTSIALCSGQLSFNQWRTSSPINYTYQGTSYLSYLGNYYSDGDQLDSDGNGVADLTFILPGNQQADEDALVDLSSQFLIQ